MDIIIAALIVSSTILVNNLIDDIFSMKLTKEISKMWTDLIREIQEMMDD